MEFRTAPRSLTPVTRLLRLCLHALLVGLLALAAARALAGAGSGAGTGAEARAVAAAAVLTAAVYAAGVRSPAVHRSARAAGLWLAVLGLSWAGLLVLSPDGVWLAFPLYFLQLHLLPLRWALPAVAVTACAAIGGFLAHSGTVNPGAFLGPLLGAAVAVATVLGYQALYRESERRRELIEELIATRAELAAAERHAGTLAERERLAREIHDTLAQGLSSIQLLLRAAERALAEAGDGAGAFVGGADAGAGEAGVIVGEAGPVGSGPIGPGAEVGSGVPVVGTAAGAFGAGQVVASGGVVGAGAAVGAGESDAAAREAAAGYIGQARQAAQDNLAEARRFVRALSPPDLAHGSLAAALERLCATAVGPRVRFSPSGTPAELPTPYEVALLRIAQSALANVVRHAAAERAEITLTFMDSSVTLDVVDDGRGFDPASAPAGEGGFGLPAMRARAESLGGTFTVESAPGQGTALAVTLPLPVEDA